MGSFPPVTNTLAFLFAREHLLIVRSPRLIPNQHLFSFHLVHREDRPTQYPRAARFRLCRRLQHRTPHGPSPRQGIGTAVVRGLPPSSDPGVCFFFTMDEVLGFPLAFLRCRVASTATHRPPPEIADDPFFSRSVQDRPNRLLIRPPGILKALKGAPSFSPGGFYSTFPNSALIWGFRTLFAIFSANFLTNPGRTLGPPLRP